MKKMAELEFKRLNENVNAIKEYIETSTIAFCDITLGVKYMWRDEYVIDYCIYNDTLIMKESTSDYKNAFYYPIGKDVFGAIEKIEEYAKTKHIPLVWCYLDDAKLEELSSRYQIKSSTYLRDWCDYIYDAKSFLTYSGKIIKPFSPSVASLLQPE